MSAVGQGNIGRYQILERIAEGGMAVVDRAVAVGPDGFKRELVLKRIRPRFSRDARFARMFVDEARIVSQLFHPNIVQIYEFGKIDGDYFVALEYVPGVDLARLLARVEKRDERFPLPLAVFIVIEVCRALDYAHRKRGPDGAPLDIVHRDVSPANVLISLEGAVKLADFGIARATERREQTLQGVVKGKVAYMSPEQLRDESLDGRADLYAAGVILYRLLAGCHPYAGNTDGETIQRALELKYPPPSHWSGAVPPALDAIVMRAIARHREERYRVPAQLVEELEAFLFDHRIRASASELAASMKSLYGQGPVVESSSSVSPDDVITLGFDKLADGEVPEYTASSERFASKEARGGGSPVVDREGRSSATKLMFNLSVEPRSTEEPSAPWERPSSDDGDSRDGPWDAPDLAAPTAPAMPGFWERSGAAAEEAVPPVGVGAAKTPTVESGESPPSRTSDAPEKSSRGVIFGLLGLVLVSVIGGGILLWALRPADERFVIADASAESTEAGQASVVVVTHGRGDAGSADGEAGTRADADSLGDQDDSGASDAAADGADGARRSAVAAELAGGANRVERPRPVSRGWLRVVTRPHYAEVFIDGHRRGTTPLLIAVPTGRRRIRLVNAQLGRSEQRVVQVRRGNLRASPATVSVRDF